jgi:hypothetical protein
MPPVSGDKILIADWVDAVGGVGLVLSVTFSGTGEKGTGVGAETASFPDSGTVVVGATPFGTETVSTTSAGWDVAELGLARLGVDIAIARIRPLASQLTR